MKQSIVPAQVTTVEDRILGNLGVGQLLLLITPLFVGSVLYIILPPMGHAAPYKTVLLIMTALTCATSSLRIKDKLLCQWVLVIANYHLRPRLHVYDKNCLRFRALPLPAIQPGLAYELTPVVSPRLQTPTLTLQDLVHIQQLLDSPLLNLTFETSKGGLHVRFTNLEA